MMIVKRTMVLSTASLGSRAGTLGPLLPSGACPVLCPVFKKLSNDHLKKVTQLNLRFMLLRYFYLKSLKIKVPYSLLLLRTQ